MEQLTLFQFICACGGIKDVFWRYKKAWGKTICFLACYSCWSMEYLDKGEGV